MSEKRLAAWVGGVCKTCGAYTHSCTCEREHSMSRLNGIFKVSLEEKLMDIEALQLEAMNILGATEGESLLQVAHRVSEQLSMMNSALASAPPTLPDKAPAKEQPGEQNEELISKIFRAFGITDYPMNRKMMRQLVDEAKEIAATPPPPERP